MCLLNLKKPLDRMNSVSQADPHVRVHPAASMLMAADVCPLSLWAREEEPVRHQVLLSRTSLCYVDTGICLCEALAVRVLSMSLRFKNVYVL